jgi:hypothetical protein
VSLATISTLDPFGIWHDERGYAVVKLTPLCSHKHKSEKTAFDCAARQLEARMRARR